MENLKIQRFLSVSYGSGFGSGSGNGSGYDDVKQLNGYEVYVIDDIQTIITSVRSDIAEGFMLNADLTLSPCFICKGENLFAHGKTLHEAYTAFQEKLLNKKPIEGKIKLF